VKIITLKELDKIGKDRLADENRKYHRIPGYNKFMNKYDVAVKILTIFPLLLVFDLMLELNFMINLYTRFYIEWPRALQLITYALTLLIFYFVAYFLLAIPHELLHCLLYSKESDKLYIIYNPPNYFGSFYDGWIPKSKMLCALLAPFFFISMALLLFMLIFHIANINYTIVLWVLIVNISTSMGDIINTIYICYNSAKALQ